MKWSNLLYPRKIFYALFIELRTIKILFKNGWPDIMLKYLGGIGDDLLYTTVAHEIKKRNRNAKIWILSQYPDLFAGNKDITRVFSPETQWYLCYSPMLRTKRRAPTYTIPKYPWSINKEDMAPQKHILKIMCEAVGIKGEIELRPYLYLTDEEKLQGRKCEKQIAIQCIGPNSGTTMYNKLWYVDRFQRVVDQILEYYDGYTLIQLGSQNDHLLKGVQDLRGKTSLRETAAILSQSKCFIGTVGFLAHLARAVECKSVIIYGGREHAWQTGYPENENLETHLVCAPCWKWNECDKNKKCMDMITTEDVFNACYKIINKSDSPR